MGNGTARNCANCGVISTANDGFVYADDGLLLIIFFTNSIMNDYE